MSEKVIRKKGGRFNVTRKKIRMKKRRNTREEMMLEKI